MTGSEWTDVPRAARLLGCEPRHVLRLLAAHDIDGHDVRVSGSRRARWVIRRESIFAFINARRPRAKK